MSLAPEHPKIFYAALEAAGMPQVPQQFSVVPHHQVIPGAVVAQIADFIRVFDRVTGRDAWQAAALRDAPKNLQLRRPEVCFFSAWDFHLSPDRGWQLIEFNDNGSGFMFAAIINSTYYEAADLARDNTAAAPSSLPAFNRLVGDFLEQEARAFFGGLPEGLFLVLEAAEALETGVFRRELELLRDLLRRRGQAAELGSPSETRWDGRQLLFRGRPVSFIVNRSTDFFWEAEDFSALRQAYEAGQVYVAPNPFTYVTRSDKRLLEWLSLPDWDAGLDVQPDERALLSAHVPETHVLRTENTQWLAERKQEFVFKPLHGFAGRGLIDSSAVGRDRLRRLIAQGKGYVAQRRVPKPQIERDGATLWTDLRVWAYRGEIFQLSGRASRRPDRLDLAPPGGWLPTFASL